MNLRAAKSRATNLIYWEACGMANPTLPDGGFDDYGIMTMIERIICS